MHYTFLYEREKIEFTASTLSSTGSVYSFLLTFSFQRAKRRASGCSGYPEVTVEPVIYAGTAVTRSNSGTRGARR